jgi:hypothetical protein
MQIREAEAADAAAVIALFERLYAETSFLLYDPGESVPQVEDYAQRMDAARAARSGAMFVVESEHTLVGALFGTRGRARRNSHSLYLVLGVLRSHWGRGSAYPCWVPSRRGRSARGCTGSS